MKQVDVTVSEMRDDAGPRPSEWYADDSMEFAAHCLAWQGMIEPMIVGIKSDGTRLAFTLPSISENKSESLFGARQLLKNLGVERYITVFEGWYLDGHGEIPKLQPSESERRKEGVTISVCDDTGVLCFRMKEIVRDDTGKFAELKEIPELAGEKPQISGSFTELLQADAWN